MTSILDACNMIITLLDFKKKTQDQGGWSLVFEGLVRVPETIQMTTQFDGALQKHYY